MNFLSATPIPFEIVRRQIQHLGAEAAKVRVLLTITKTDKPHYTTHWNGDVLRIDPPVRMTCPSHACGNKIAVDTDPEMKSCWKCAAIVRVNRDIGLYPSGIFD